jgi:hypothetical protein
VQDSAGLRIMNFRDEESISVTNEAQGSLPGFEFNVWVALYRMILRLRSFHPETSYDSHVLFA